MQDTNTQPRNNTGEVKAKLRSYGILQRRIDHQITRLENLVETIDSIASANYSGMPSGPHDGVSKAERYVEKKDELERKIDSMIQQEKILRKEVEELIALLPDPDEQACLEMKYVDVMDWQDVAFGLFGMLAEYESHKERYMKRTFKLHGAALQRLSEICWEKRPPQLQ